MAMITDPSDYFAKGCGRCARFDTPDCSALRWASGLAALRRICLDAGLEETARWGHPCYRHAGRNIVLFGALRGDVRLSFFESGLLADPDALLEPAGPNTPHRNTLRICGVEEVARLEPALRALLAESMAHAEAGRRAPKAAADIDLPDELVAALDTDPDLAEAFHALTPGRQRSYVIALASAKTSATREARIIRLRDKILAGKGANER